jgi:hypothetical protein
MQGDDKTAVAKKRLNLGHQTISAAEAGSFTFSLEEIGDASR